MPGNPLPDSYPEREIDEPGWGEWEAPADFNTDDDAGGLSPLFNRPRELPREPIVTERNRLATADHPVVMARPRNMPSAELLYHPVIGYHWGARPSCGPNCRSVTEEERRHITIT